MLPSRTRSPSTPTSTRSESSRRIGGISTSRLSPASSRKRRIRRTGLITRRMRRRLSHTGPITVPTAIPRGRVSGPGHNTVPTAVLMLLLLPSFPGPA
uniref:Uncharacterized protein n=1 Tax=Lotus japonicus TaxID=34305 RepID=I3S5Z8_LOTJA|nr:unknown [Lotus japonicus]